MCFLRTVPHPRTLVSPMCLSLDVDSQSTAATLVTENPRNCKPGPDAFGQEDEYTILPSPWFVCCLHRPYLHALIFSTYGLHSFTAVKDRASEKGAGALVLGKILSHRSRLYRPVRHLLHPVDGVRGNRHRVVRCICHSCRRIRQARRQRYSCQLTAMLLLRRQHDKGETCRGMIR